MWIFTFSLRDCDQGVLIIWGFLNIFNLQTPVCCLQEETYFGHLGAGEGLKVDLKLEKILLISGFCPGLQLCTALDIIVWEVKSSEPVISGLW